MFSVEENSREIGREVDDAERVDSESEGLMQDWKGWTERWTADLHDERDTFAEIRVSVDRDTIDGPHCDSEALIQKWRKWSERWEKLVKSR